MKVKVDLDVDGTVKAIRHSFPDGSIFTSASPSVNQRKNVYLFNEFLTTAASQPPWTGTAGGSGTFGVGNVSQLTGRPGVAVIGTSATANSGYSFVTQTMFILTGGESTTFLCSFTNSVATEAIRMGFGDFSSAVVASANGIYFEILNGSAKGVTAKSSTRTNTATSYTFAANTFYHFVIELNAGASEVTFTIYSEAGVQLWQEKVTTNIPTSALFQGIRASSSGTTVVNLVALDFMDINIPLAAIRGRAS